MATNDEIIKKYDLEGDGAHMKIRALKKEYKVD